MAASPTRLSNSPTSPLKREVDLLLPSRKQAPMIEPRSRSLAKHKPLASPSKMANHLQTQSSTPSTSPSKRPPPLSNPSETPISSQPSSRPSTPSKHATDITYTVSPQGIYFSTTLDETKIAPREDRVVSGSPTRMVLEEAGAVGKDGRVTPTRTLSPAKKRGGMAVTRTPSPLKGFVVNSSTPSRQGGRTPSPMKDLNGNREPASPVRILPRSVAATTRTTANKQSASTAAKGTSSPALPLSSQNDSKDRSSLAGRRAPVGTTRKKAYPKNIGEMMRGLSALTLNTESSANESTRQMEGEDPGLQKTLQRGSPTLTPDELTSKAPKTIASPINSENNDDRPSKTHIGTHPVVQEAIEAGMNDVRLDLYRIFGPEYFTSNKHRRSAADGPKSTPIEKSDIGLHGNVAAAKADVAGVPTPMRGITARTGGVPAQTPLCSHQISPQISKPYATTVASQAKSKTLARTASAKLPANGANGAVKRLSALRSRVPTHTRTPLSNPADRPPYNPAADPRPYEERFASAQDIARQLEQWSIEEKQAHNEPVQPKTFKPAVAPSFGTTSAPTPVSSSSTSSSTQKANVIESYTPEGSPTNSDSFLKARASRSTPSNAAPITPVPGKCILDHVKRRERAGVRTPSREVQSKLDRAIDEQLEKDAREGRVFTPGGQRISELLERKKG